METTPSQEPLASPEPSTHNDAADSEATQAAAHGSSTAETATTDAAESAAAAPRRSRQPSMAQIMESDEFSEYLSGADQLSRNALLTGTVAHVDENTGVVLVDIGAKSEGLIPKNEVGDDEVKVGDEIEVVVVQPEDEDGHPVVSKRRADFERLWRSIAKARDENTTLQATVTREVKGGLIVDLGVPAFIPASHVSTRNRSNLGHMVGKTIPVRVIEVERKKDKVIASHRLAADEERKQREGEAWSRLKKDEVVEGVVRRITDFGAFVDLGGIDGLLHVREMGWGRVEHPDHVVKKGQKLQVLILDIDEERKRIALGLKQLQSDPWKQAAKSFRTGQTVNGKITHIAPSCAFVELEGGIEAIIPISEMSEERIKTPEDVVQVGQQVEARVKTVQPNQRKITLSLRAAARDKERRETRTAIREVNQRATGGDEGPLRLGDIFGAQLREARERTKDRKKNRDDAKTRAQRLAEEEEWDGELEETETEEAGADEVEVEAGVEVETQAEADETGAEDSGSEAAEEEAPAEAVATLADGDASAGSQINVEAEAESAAEADATSVALTPEDAGAENAAA
jgi:4-hydroxy-3-methylbut-2-enyl diphosphate reductase